VLLALTNLKCKNNGGWLKAVFLNMYNKI